MDSNITKTDIIPHIFNTGYTAYFALVYMNKRAIASRGLSPMNQAYILDPEIFFLNRRILLAIPGWMMQMKRPNRPFQNCLQWPPCIWRALLRLRMHHFRASIQLPDWTGQFWRDFSSMLSTNMPRMRGGVSWSMDIWGTNPLKNVGVVGWRCIWYWGFFAQQISVISLS